MPFTQSEYTLFAIVGQSSGGSPEVLGLQTNLPALTWDDFGIAAHNWSVSSVAPITLTDGVTVVDLTGHILAARDTSTPFATEGFLGLSFIGATPPDARPFIENLSTTVEIQYGSDPVADLQTVTLHFRAIPPPVLVRPPSTSGPATVFGSSLASDAMGFQITAPPAASWTGGVQWVAALPTDPTFADDGLSSDGGPKAAVSSGDLGGFVLSIEGTANTQFNSATFDPAALPSTTVNTETWAFGAIDNELLEANPPTLTVTAPHQVGVNEVKASVIEVSIDVTADALVARRDITVTLSVTRRDGTAVPSTDLTYDSTLAVPAWGWSTDPQGFADSIGHDLTVVDEADASPVHADGWADYERAGESFGTISYTLRLEVPDAYSEIDVAVSLTDLLDQPAADSTLTRLEAPTDAVLCLDRSGSMTGAASSDLSKWEAANLAANVFHTIFREVMANFEVPTVNAGDPSIIDVAPLDSREGVAFFNAPGGTDASTIPTLATPIAGALPPAPAAGGVAEGNPGGLTPIEAGLTKCINAIDKASEWRNRFIILMTDGKENVGMMQNVADASTVKPDPLNPQASDLRIHGVTFGSTAATDEPTVSAFVSEFDGLFQSTASFADPPTEATDPGVFVNTFVDLLVASTDSLGKAHLAGGGAPTGLVPVGDQVTVEGHVSRVVFVLASASGTATLSGPSAGTAVQVPEADITYWTIDDPTAGDYTVNDAAGGEFVAVVDLRLVSAFAVEGDGVAGEPLTLKARIADAGKPVTDAEVWVYLNGPGYSEGDLVTRYMLATKGKRLKKQLRRDRRSFLALAPSASHLRRWSPLAREPINLRHELVRRAAAYFGISIDARSRAPRIRLQHVGKGRYEATLPTSTEGSYGFSFEARGTMGGGYPFSRAHSVSRYLLPVPDSEQTTVAWDGGQLIDQKVRRWQVVIRPVQQSGNPLGPGQQLSLGVKGRKEPVALVDRWDGTYVATIDLKPDESRPALSLIYRKRAIDLKSSGTRCDVHRVRVVLEAIQITEKHDPDGTEELAFMALVSPNRNPHGSVLSALSLRAKVGEKVKLDRVLYDGLLKDPTSLLVLIAGAELDLEGYLAAAMSKGVKAERLAPYSRIFRGPIAKWEGSHGPRDEVPDPEELEDWNVWLHIELL